MLVTEQQEFVEPQYPAFPVVFHQAQQQFHGNAQARKKENKNSSGIKISRIPAEKPEQLLCLLEKRYKSDYSSMVRNPPKGFGEFLKSYIGIERQFVEGMEEEKVHIKRLGGNTVYIGEVEQGRCHGRGIVLGNGWVYEGWMVDNQREGRGTFVKSDEGYYQGEFQANQKKGEGLEVMYNKCAYLGNFDNDLRHESGLYVDSNSNIYYGIWKLGIMHGQGNLQTSASIYSGDFVNGLRHGQGEEYFNNGDVYAGEYQNGRFDGYGRYQWKDQGVYEGNFKNGVRHGKGKWSGGETKYNGGYVEGLKEGYGELYYPSGNFYKGNFLNDKREGYGEIFWTDGSFYKGQWRNGIQNGKGQVYLIGSDIITGLFDNSMLVQVIPSIYEKQMEISDKNLHELLRGQKTGQQPRNRVFSENKQMNPRKRLSKIEESVHSNKKKNMRESLYLKSPHNHNDPHHECSTCARRLENFRLKQVKKQKQDRSFHKT